MTDNRDDALIRARKMREDGMTWGRIAARLGVSDDWLRRRLDPGYGERRNNMARAWRGHITHFIPVLDRKRLAADEIKRLMASLPTDTRGLTARAMGDPLPGRSALDMRRGAANG